MTGGAVISHERAVVVAEGSVKAQKRYGKLMLQRIDWNARREDEDVAARWEPPLLPLGSCDVPTVLWQHPTFEALLCQCRAPHHSSTADCPMPSAVRQVQSELLWVLLFTSL